MHSRYTKCVPTVKIAYLGMKYAVGAQKYAVGKWD